jgi:hypothetical protein
MVKMAANRIRRLLNVTDGTDVLPMVADILKNTHSVCENTDYFNCVKHVLILLKSDF